MPLTTLADILADADTEQPAIISEPDGETISYRALAAEVDRLADLAAGSDLRAGDAVALVLPNGPALLTLILALTRARLTVAPLNPAFKEDELRGVLQSLEPSAIIDDGGNNAVGVCAVERRLPRWTVSLDSSGRLSLASVRSTGRAVSRSPTAEDVALLMLTSGTEGQPKVVPLTQANVVLSAQHIAASYALTPADRSLVVLPLFHGHGLIGAALSTLASRGAVILPPRFSASQFWNTFRSRGATWFTAVPTIHQILLARAESDNAPHDGARFLRSCSAALAPAVMDALGDRFGAPVVEAYGLTEASHQVTSNPLPPGIRKSASVGMAAGTEIAIVDVWGHHLPPGSEGEIVVSGPTVMHGYRDNPGATAAAFVDGWLRTGDAGIIDGDGYLSITGRIKEMINRGGEKISPTEIDNVLLSNPVVAEAATFGVPDAKYGEEVEAAVVLKGDIDAQALQAFCRERLADFKVPKVIRIVSDLPKNAMGKVDRRALTALYGSPT
jgi:oxalate---CoA ligase